MTPSYSEISYFVEVAQTKNMSRAADRLGVTQPTLSSAIKRLEDTVGTPLLIRNRTGVQLTKAGKKLYSGGKTLLLSWSQLRADILKSETDVSGQYSIGCHPSVGAYTLSKFLPRGGHH